MVKKYKPKKIWTAVGWTKNSGFVMLKARTKYTLMNKVKKYKWRKGSPSIKDRHFKDYKY
jgi:hypothetical protein